MVDKDCIRRKSFKWAPINHERIALNTPNKCENCEETRLDECMQKSWTENGKEAEEYQNVTVLVNIPDAEHVDINPAENHEEETDEESGEEDE